MNGSLNARADTFEKLTELTLEKFDSKPRVYGSFYFFKCRSRVFQVRSIVQHNPTTLKTFSVSLMTQALMNLDFIVLSPAGLLILVLMLLCV